jgi:predicted membrane-bound mannosyltransferase
VVILDSKMAAVVGAAVVVMAAVVVGVMAINEMTETNRPLAFFTN